MVDRANYEVVARGMRQAVLGGTCRVANNPWYEVCGKTGTAQNPHGKDHSVFMGFAPMNDPKIAICVYVENGTWGATYGVPIGALMMEQYINGKLSPESMRKAEVFEHKYLYSPTFYVNGNSEQQLGERQRSIPIVRLVYHSDLSHPSGNGMDECLWCQL